MPVDTSIYGLIRPMRIEGPLDQFAKGMSVRNLITQGELQDLQRKQTVDAMGRQQQLRDLFASGTPSPQEVMAVDPSTGLQLLKDQREARKTDAQTKKAEIDALGAATKILRDRTATVQDDAGMAFLRDEAVRLFGPDIAAKMNIPERFDPAWKEQQIMTADKLLSQLEAARQRDFQERQNALTRGETARHNRVMEGQGAARLAHEGIAAPGSPAATGSQPVSAPASPGMSPKDRAKLEAEKPKATAALENSMSNLDRLISEAKAIKSHPGLKAVSGMGDWKTLGIPGARFIPGTDAANAHAKLETLKSQIAFSVLQAMRDASKTGGALGQVSERELDLLQNNLAALDTWQGDEQFKESLQQVIDYAEGVKKRLREAYDQTYGGQSGGGIKFLGFEGQ